MSKGKFPISLTSKGHLTYIESMQEATTHIGNHPVNTNVLYKNLKTISFYFFIIIAAIHFLSGLFIANQISIRPAWLVNRLLDVPLFLVSYIYFSALFKLKLEPKAVHFNLWDLVIMVVGIALFVIIQLYDLIFPNSLPL